MTELLLDDEPTPPDGGRRRPRWVDALGLVVIVGALIGVGTVGGGGDKHVTPRPSTTTTTAPATSTTTEPAPAPTTTEPPAIGSVLQLGALLPVPTHTVLALVGPNGVSLLDLDAHTLRSTIGLNGGPVLVGDHGFIVGRGGSIAFVPSDGQEPRTTETALFQTGLWVGGPNHWVARDRIDVLHELDALGHLTGRQVTIPRDASAVAAVHDGLVVAQEGSITVLDPSSGARRAVGTGTPRAASARTIADEVCRALECKLTLLDADRGTSTAITGVPAFVGRREAQFSPDGRWLAVNATDEPDGGFFALVDVAGHRAVLDDDAPTSAMTFSPDSRFLFTARTGRLFAYELPSLKRFDLDQVPTAAVYVLRATAR